MSCHITELRDKEVINIHDGFRFGYIFDCEVDLDGGRILSVIIPGRTRFFGLFGRDDDYVIPWENVKKIGEDILLVDYEAPPYANSRHLRRKNG